MGRLPLSPGLHRGAAHRAPETEIAAQAPSPGLAPAPTDASAQAKPLTARQQAFVEHYVVSRNASDAARKAGYAAANADVHGPRLMGNGGIRAEIDRRLGELAQKHAITAERVLAEIGNVAFLNMANYLGADGLPTWDFGKLPRDHTAAIKSITVEEFKDGRSDKREVRRLKFALADKGKGLEMLAKHFGLFAPEQHEHDHKHEHTVVGVLLREIDAEARGQMIEHDDAA